MNTEVCRSAVAGRQILHAEEKKGMEVSGIS
jgi:hypothetical protein